MLRPDYQTISHMALIIAASQGYALPRPPWVTCGHRKPTHGSVLARCSESRPYSRSCTGRQLGASDPCRAGMLAWQSWVSPSPTQFLRWPWRRLSRLRARRVGTFSLREMPFTRQGAVKFRLCSHRPAREVPNEQHARDSLRQERRQLRGLWVRVHSTSYTSPASSRTLTSR
jgi:hypothetical protein